MLYTIEVGTVEDFDQILKVNKRIFKGLKRPDLVKREFYEDLFKKKNLPLLVKEGKMVVGDTIAVARAKNYHIAIVALTIEHMRHGVALKLLNMNKQLAKDNDFKAISITVYDNQKELLRIVEEAGFKPYRKSLKEGFKDYKIEF